ncbi:hypothetical protein M413DRAFT_450142, partial [Hebeloma cylindrosporum]
MKAERDRTQANSEKRHSMYTMKSKHKEKKSSESRRGSAQYNRVLPDRKVPIPKHRYTMRIFAMGSYL